MVNFEFLIAFAADASVSSLYLELTLLTYFCSAIFKV